MLGAGLGVQARRQQADGRAGTARACADGRAGTARACADGRAGTARACADGRAGAGRASGRELGARALGAQDERAHRRWALGALGERARSRGARQGERTRGWASGRAAGRTVRAGHGRQAARARSLCAQAGPAGPGWGFVHLAWFSARFFDSVFFLSHKMNTVHYKINFRKKKIY